jgi:transcriptional regulator with XRE-family HTH domain
MEIQTRLLELRKKLKLSQKVLSEETGISQANYSKYEKGVIDPSYSFMNILIEKFNVNSNWLFTGKGKMFLDREDCPVKDGEGKEEIRRQLEEAQGELRRLREETASLREDNQELNHEIAERLREIVGLQRKLIPKTRRDLELRIKDYIRRT